MNLTIEQKMTRRLRASIQGSRHIRVVILAFLKNASRGSDGPSVLGQKLGLILEGFAIGCNSSDDFDVSKVSGVARAVADKIVQEELK